MGHVAKGPQARARRQAAAAARHRAADIASASIPDQAFRDDLTWLRVRGTDRHTAISAVQVALDDPYCRIRLNATDLAEARQKASGVVFELRGYNWVFASAIHGDGQLDHCPGNTILRVFQYELCDLHFDSCTTHCSGGPVTDATHAIQGTTLGPDGRPNGEGVIVWAYSPEDAENQLARVQRCRYISDDVEIIMIKFDERVTSSHA